MKPGTYFVLGNEACAEGAINAGCKFFAGYPITPATEIAEYLSIRLPQIKGYFLQLEDEIAAICSVIGASWTGAKAMTATSGPGFSLMQEAISYAYHTETPIVIIEVSRSGPSTGQATYPSQQDFYQVRYGAHGDYEAVVLTPWSVQEAFDFTIKSFNLAETYRVPVILMMDGAIGHSREKLTIPDPASLSIINRKIKIGHCEPFKPIDDTLVPPMPLFGSGCNLLVTGSAHESSGLRNYNPTIHSQTVQRITTKIKQATNKICEIESQFMEDAEYVILSYGASARSAYGAVQKLRSKYKVGFIRLKTLWPFPDELLEKELAEKIKSIFIPEMNIGKAVREIQRINKTAKIVSISKLGGLIPSIEDIVKKFEKEV
ncbi:MAG: 2-oxoacid:acceptor oxidoreductase subunit alpha [Candidatus Hodarchaeota archaeon]